MEIKFIEGIEGDYAFNVTAQIIVYHCTCCGGHKTSISIKVYACTGIADAVSKAAEKVRASYDEPGKWVDIEALHFTQYSPL